ncbi:MAG: hypothetical protein EOP84_22365 [Verrucomicrobiaceae bacterium]|nr:MAG: hypothetical protein EOP84_22365 [Verrucomicrobiaceae bacterium]
MCMENEDKSIWVFNGERSCFPSGLFLELNVAEAWISSHGLTGVLTRYPYDVGAYDHAVENGFFEPKKDEHRTPAFIGRFSSGGFEHHHYENEKRA